MNVWMDKDKSDINKSTACGTNARLSGAVI